MPLYVLNLWEDEAPYTEGGEADFEAVMKLHRAFSAAVKAAGGREIGGEALRGIKSATFVADPGKPTAMVIDNPLPEIKEQLGGFYILDLPDEATALELAKVAPAPYGFAELRPVWDFANEPSASAH